MVLDRGEVESLSASPLLFISKPLHGQIDKVPLESDGVPGVAIHKVRPVVRGG